MTAAAIGKAAKAFGRAGVDAPRRNAEALMAKALGWERAKLLAEPGHPLSPGEALAFGNLCRRRACREPLDYLLGRAHFAGIELACDRRALIPRPETEDLVELAVRALKDVPAPRIADIGTGTGAIALAIKARLPKAEVVATDASGETLSLARENARHLGLDVAFREGPDLDPLAGERFDAIGANPPYVTEAEFPGLMPEVRDWEPRAALVAGPEGTEILARWIAAAPRHLNPGGWLAVEMGAGQAPRVMAAFTSAGFSAIGTTQDFAGIPRFVHGRVG